MLNSSLDLRYKNTLIPILSIYLKELVQRQELNQKSREHFFLSREGRIFFDLAKEYNRNHESKINSRYLEVSRRSLARLLVAKGQLAGKFVTKEYFNGTVGELWINRFGVPNDCVSQVLTSNRAKERIQPGSKSQILNELSIANNICPQFLEEEYSAGYEYLSAFFTNVENEFVICDIGYSGTMQEMLKSILKIDFYGLYLALDPKNSSDDHKSGVLTSDISKAILKNTRIVEALFNCGLPTVVGYKKNDSGSEPIYSQETIRNARFKTLQSLAISEAINLHALPEDVLHCWVNGNYPALEQEYKNSDEGISDLKQFEDLWSGKSTW